MQEDSADLEAISYGEAFPGHAADATVDQAGIAVSDAAMHSLVWYETGAEVDAEQLRPVDRLKPKTELVQWIQRLPAERRIPALRRLGLARSGTGAERPR